MSKMGGKFLSGAGALFLVVFGVALTEYWKSEFVQGIIQFVLNIPAMLVAPVGVQLWLVIVAASVIAYVILKAVVIATNQKFERLRPTESVADPVADILAPELLHDVTDEQKKVLAFLANAADVQEYVKIKVIHTSIGLGSLVVDHAVNQLLDNGFLLLQKNYHTGNLVELSPKGKKYVVENAIPLADGQWTFLSAV